MARRRGRARMFGRTRRVARRARRGVRRAGGFISRLAGRSRHTFSGLPRWAKPSTIVGIAGVTSGVIQLVMPPLPNGDSWIGRMKSGYDSFQSSKNPFDLLAQDDAGNNAVSILGLQMQQNALGAIGTVTGFGLTAILLKKFGL